ncbi:hypothetical protein [Campylobacter sp. CS_ED2]|uniref:hypothetical protein n=1 Tax=Campylobacter sp. CS_ED2 TaxID=2984141 RepID=UPI0022E9C242|nr:hypothetical protein [Campylobacter sp. CS_ED2]
MIKKSALFWEFAEIWLNLIYLNLSPNLGNNLKNSVKICPFKFKKFKLVKIQKNIHYKFKLKNYIITL